MHPRYFDIPVITTNNQFWEFFTWSCKDSSLPKDDPHENLLESIIVLNIWNLEVRINSIEGSSDYESVENSSDEISICK